MPLDRADRLTLANVVLSLAFSAALFAWHALLDSALAFGQAADSLLDVLTALLLAWAVRLSRQPSDANHPAGHRSAEPLAALWVAALALLLAYRVGAEAVGTLWSGGEVPFSLPLLATFAGKALARGGIVMAIDRTARRDLGPALRALRVDARNDVLFSLSSVLAVVVSRWHPWADPAVALPLAGWIAWSGFELARDNGRLLMGAAPDPERQQALERIAADVEGIRGVHDLRAYALGAHLGVRLRVEVDSGLSAAQAHDLGERVRLAIEAEPDVDRCDVHIDVVGHAPAAS